MREISTDRRKTRGREARVLLALSLLVIMALFFPLGGTAADGARPLWTEGDTWTVRAVYPVQGGGWSKPVLWEYRVAGVPGSGSGGYALEVTGLDGAPEVKARLTYRNDFSLAGAEIVRTLRGRSVVTALEYEAGAPVLTGRSPVPFDTPVFPLLAPSSGDYRAKRTIGDGLSVSVSVRQSAAADPGDEDILEVTCAWGDGERFVQRWKNNRPWPVYGENRNMKYWLVEK